MKMKFNITGLDCPNCALKLADLIEKNDGIESAKVNFLTEKVTVETQLDEQATLLVLKKTAADFSGKVVIEK